MIYLNKSYFFGCFYTHFFSPLTLSPPLTPSHYTRRSTRSASVLMDVFPSSAGGLRPPGAWSRRGLKPPSVCRLSRSLAATSASPSIAAIAKQTRHGASTAATRELCGARAVCEGSQTHTHTHNHTHTHTHTRIQPRCCLMIPSYQNWHHDPLSPK